MIEEFYDIVQTLFQQRYVLINGNKYQICEVEFYLYDDYHADVYTHRHPNQLQGGKWHFHRASKKYDSGYKGGTRKGLDLTLSQDNGHEYYSVLIRSIYNCNRKQIVTGPCNVVDHILQQYGVDSILQLQGNDTSLDANDNWREFILYQDDNLLSQQSRSNEYWPIYYGPRVGLNPDTDPYYANAYYRFVQRYSDIKKDKKKLFPYPTTTTTCY